MLVTLALASCSLWGPVRTDLSAERYSYTKPPSPWEQQQASDVRADLLFLHKPSRNLLAVNSLCDRYSQLTLRSLSRQLMGDFEDLEIVSQESRMVAGREGLLSLVRGKVEGVIVESKIVVFRKQKCIFDITLHAKESISEESSQTFDKFLDTFVYDRGVKE